LRGDAGVIAVLHTHSRELKYHPHIHVVMPVAIVDKTNKHWRTKESKYLFNHKALAKVLTRMSEEKLPFPTKIPKNGPWIASLSAQAAKL